MTCFVRDETGAMVNLDHMTDLRVHHRGEVFSVEAANGQSSWVIRTFDDRESAEGFLNLIAARGNINARGPEPISGYEQHVLSRGLRFGPPTKRADR